MDNISKMKISDGAMKAKWLSWNVLFSAGLSHSDAEKLFNEKFYNKIRLHTIKYFKNKEFNKKNIIRFLIEEKNFKLKKAIEIVGDFDINCIYSINQFIKKYNKILKFRNYDKKWYLERGYSELETKTLLDDFFKLGSKKTKEKCEQDKNYNEWYLKTRKPGAIAAALSNSRNSSLFETKLKELLNQLDYKNKDYFTPVFDTFFDNKKNYVHDMFIDNCIIEYNGGYWHKDFTKFKQFSEREYLKEIYKAKYCIDFERKNKPNYILIWENDFNTVIDAAQFIIDCLNIKCNSTFFSSRELDIKYYNQIKKYDNIDKKFLDIADSFAERSKCVSKKVACLIVKNNRIISTGLNGTYPGSPNCNEIFDKNNFDRKKHHEFSKSCEIHAEMSAIINATKNGISISDDCTIYCNLEPCSDCLKNLFMLDIKRIVYRYKYDYNDDLYHRFKNFIISNGIEIKHLK